MAYDNSNSGVLFKNDRKEQPNHPDYKGNAEVDGAEYWLSAWIKEDKNGKKYMSLAFSPRQQQAEQESPQQQEDDGIPF